MALPLEFVGVPDVVRVEEGNPSTGRGADSEVSRRGGAAVSLANDPRAGACGH
jgi:hypothetical protein